VPETVPRHPAATVYPPVPASVVPPVLLPSAALLPPSAANDVLVAVLPAGCHLPTTLPDDISTVLDSASPPPVPATTFSPIPPSAAGPTSHVPRNVSSPSKAPPVAMLNHHTFWEAAASVPFQEAAASVPMLLDAHHSVHHTFREANASVPALLDADQEDPVLNIDEATVHQHRVRSKS